METGQPPVHEKIPGDQPKWLAAGTTTAEFERSEP
ncbi:hypothetical protein M2175_004226 [Bradyrhizobium elkanii]|nr:hypothetical protein [Bradyrhizobium elkanii]MCS3969751.1 hypothetical protein [Bradyrhizobium japonicum]